MSWLARSIADSLGIDAGVDLDHSGDEREQRPEKRDQPPDTEHVGKLESESASREAQSSESEEEEEEEDDEDPSRGVKEDLTELKQTLTRQFWGVASFLAPPPPPPPPPPRLDRIKPELDGEVVECDGANGALVDGEEEEGLHLDQGVSLQNGSEFGEETEISDTEEAASNIVDLDAVVPAALEEEEAEVWDVVGITEEVLTFGTNIAMHPETWLDYPVEEEDDPDGMPSPP